MRSGTAERCVPRAPDAQDGSEKFEANRVGSAADAAGLGAEAGHDILGRAPADISPTDGPCGSSSPGRNPTADGAARALPRPVTSRCVVPPDGDGRRLKRT